MHVTYHTQHALQAALAAQFSEAQLKINDQTSIQMRLQKKITELQAEVQRVRY